MDPTTTLSNETLKTWAEQRADDAGRLARELLALRAEVKAVRDSEAIYKAFHDLHASGKSLEAWQQLMDRAEKAEAEVKALREACENAVETIACASPYGGCEKRPCDNCYASRILVAALKQGDPS